MGIECIVAPYEADAQLAYLSIKGYVQAVIRCNCNILLLESPADLFTNSNDCEEHLRAGTHYLAHSNHAYDRCHALKISAHEYSPSCKRANSR